MRSTRRGQATHTASATVLNSPKVILWAAKTLQRDLKDVWEREHLGGHEGVELSLSFTCVAKVEILVRKLLPVDAHPARAVSLHEVSPLEHEVLDHAVERCALVSGRYALSCRHETVNIEGITNIIVSCKSQAKW